MDSKKLALTCRELAENRKAENVVVLDVHEVSSITDYFVIATGTSEPHLRAIVDEITEKLREDHDLKPKHMDGSLHTAWVVLDYFDVIVHVMRADVRDHYKLEDLWGDVPGEAAQNPRKKSCYNKVTGGSFSGGFAQQPQRLKLIGAGRIQPSTRLPPI